jgi:hypothetical protein
MLLPAFDCPLHQPLLARGPLARPGAGLELRTPASVACDRGGISLLHACLPSLAIVAAHKRGPVRVILRLLILGRSHPGMWGCGTCHSPICSTSCGNRRPASTHRPASHVGAAVDRLGGIGQHPGGASLFQYIPPSFSSGLVSGWSMLGNLRGWWGIGRLQLRCLRFYEGGEGVHLFCVSG